MYMQAYMSLCYTPSKGLTYNTWLTINMEYFLLTSFHEMIFGNIWFVFDRQRFYPLKTLFGSISIINI